MKYSLRENILRFDRPVPRYTSYPTAPHFQPLEDKTTYQDWLEDLPVQSNLSLYLHVPYCPKLCWYCGCHTKITKRYAPVEDYAYLMMQEIRILSDKLGKNHTVTHIHFGGGSPSMLRACDFKKIMDKLHSNFSISSEAEIAIEVDPRGVTEGRVATYAKNGVNRISLGVQDFDKTVLEAVNRPQPFHLSYNAATLFRDYGIDQINLDLLYGLPHQTPETMTQTIQKALLLNPDRIALFGYAHVPWVKKHMRLIDDTALPDVNRRFDLFETGAEKLEEAGYRAVGIDHFAKPDNTLVKAAKSGRLKRNFQGYTSDISDAMIGIGASSIGHFKNGYSQNVVDMSGYKKSILGGHLPAQKFYLLSGEDCLRHAVIERLMCDFNVNVHELCTAHGFSENYLDQEIQAFGTYERLGILKTNKKGLVSIDPAARAMVRIICSVFDTYMDQASQQLKHSRAI